MCGRYAAAKDTATLVEEFDVAEVVDPAPDANYNVAPTNQVTFVVDRPVEEGAVRRQLRSARWGLVPSWAKDQKIGARMINARWENAATKPAFRAAFAKRRCLIPADGYYEWYVPAGGSGGRVPKQPYFIHRPDGSSLALAGLYEFWRPAPDQPWLVTVSVLTTQAQGPAARIHDRMPVIVDAAGYSRWLDPGSGVGPDFGDLLVADRLIAYPVSTAVNSVRNNGPELIAPIPAEPEPTDHT